MRREEIPDEINFDKDSEREIPDEQVASPEEIAAENEKEAELSPEVIEMIMEKVQDLNKKGIAYHKLENETFNSVLREGLLGGYEGNDDGFKRKPIRSGKEWEKMARKTRKAVVFFNIVGRLQKPKEEGGYSYDLDREFSVEEQYLSKKTEIGKSHYSGGAGLTILFDVSKYREFVPLSDTVLGDMKKLKSRTFRAQWPASYNSEEEMNMPIDKDNLPLVTSEWGFALSQRVSPKLFQGIVLAPWKKRWTKEEIEAQIVEAKSSIEKGSNVYKSFTPSRWEEWRRYLERETQWGGEDYLPQNLEESVKIMRDAYLGDIENMLPIYDTYGNLLWPKEMNYEEVKKFVEERSKKDE